MKQKALQEGFAKGPVPLGAPSLIAASNSLLATSRSAPVGTWHEAGCPEVAPVAAVNGHLRASRRLVSLYHRVEKRFPLIPARKFGEKEPFWQF
jgi:hypothetical protein